MKRLVVIGLAPLALLVACKRDADVATEALTARGLTEISLTEVADQKGIFDVIAKKGEDECTGQIGVDGNASGAAFDKVECQPPPGLIQKGLPDDAPKEMVDEARKCDHGEPKFCVTLAMRYEKGQGVDKNYATAGRLHKIACESGVMEGCNGWAFALAGGVSGTQDLPKARELWGKACEAGIQEGCTHLAGMELQGQGGPADPGAARTHVGPACDAGDTWACGLMGVMLYAGLGGNHDKPKGKTMMKAACDAGHQDICDTLKSSR